MLLLLQGAVGNRASHTGSQNIPAGHEPLPVPTSWPIVVWPALFWWNDQLHCTELVSAASRSGTTAATQ